MDVLHLVGRIMYGGFFVMAGLNHILNLGEMKGYAASRGLPAPGLAVAGTGILLLVGGLTVALGIWTRVGLWLLILFLVAAAFLMHNFWALPDDQKQMEMINFQKNLALAGAALMMLVFPDGAWPFGLGE